MARYSGTITDQNNVPQAGARVLVQVSATAELADLTSDSGGPLSNPLTADPLGSFAFNVGGGFYDLTYQATKGGRVIRQTFGVLIGAATLQPGAVIDSMGASPIAAPSQRAVSEAVSAFSAPDGVNLVGGAVARYPSSAYSPLQSGYQRALSDFIATWWDATNNHLKPTNGGGITNGLYVSTLTKPSMWQMWEAFNVLYEAWRLALDTGGAASTYSAMLQGQWAYIKSCYTATDLRTGSNGVYTTMDDGALHACGLMQVADFFGPAAEGALALSYLVEFIPNLTLAFRDPLQTGADLIDYGASTPLGVAFKSNRYGILYSAASDPSSIAIYGYKSVAIEAGVALAAAYVAKQTSVSSSMRAAMQAYAANVWTHLTTRLKTGAPADASKAGAGIYWEGYNLDPNVNANNVPSVNGGVAQRGYYDVNQVYHQPVDGYFGKPVRGITAHYEAGTEAVGALSAALYGITGTAAYATEAISVASALIQPNTFGRAVDGMVLIGNIRDPHSAGYFWPMFMRAALLVPGFDPDKSLRAAVINTARGLLQSSVRGLLGPNWAGEELNPSDGTYTWEDTSANQGNVGGGHAKREQIMVSSGGLSLVQAAMQARALETSLGSGLSAPFAIDMVASLVSALRRAAAESLSREGGNLTGPLSIKDLNYKLDNIGGDPFISVDTGGDLYNYARILDFHQWFIANTERLRIAATGLEVFGGMTHHGSVQSFADNVDSLGNGSRRYTQVYAATGTINTSDERLKEWRGSLTSAELAAAREIAGGIGIYRFIEAVAAKGDGARFHTGVRAQHVIDILEAHGLDAMSYAFICHDEWDADAGLPAFEVMTGDGTMMSQETPAAAAGDRYGIRYDELAMFLCAAQEQRILAIEAAN